MVSFGESVRQLRLARGLQQKQLATAIGLEATYLSRIETGRVPPPSEETIRAIARVLDTEPEPLILSASKVPSDLKDMILSSPRAPEFLRTAKRLGDDEWDQLIAMASRLAKVK